jgi:hypothetical protein
MSQIDFPVFVTLSLLWRELTCSAFRCIVKAGSHYNTVLLTWVENELLKDVHFCSFILKFSGIIELIGQIRKSEGFKGKNPDNICGGQQYLQFSL